jgi:uncharacterized protein
MADFVERHDADAVQLVDDLPLETLERGQLHRLALRLVDDGASYVIRVPVLVAHGAKPGKVVGLTAALHGNELNGIPTIHRLFHRIDPRELQGTVVAVPIANMAGYLTGQREYLDGKDLNRLMPGKPDGSESQVYAYRFLERIVRHFQVLVDLHTASFGRINSLYVRADMGSPVTAHLARVLGAEIIVHNAGGDGTLRAAAAEMGIPGVTVEIGDPHVFEHGKIKASRIGLRDVLEDMGMLAPDGERASHIAVECSHSYWLFTDAGGLLEVLPNPTDRVIRGEIIATLDDPWGQRIRTYRAPEDGIVVGKGTNPVAHTGSRILHLGVVGTV